MSGVLLLGLGLAGCTTVPPKPPAGTWGYEFDLGTFLDERKQDDAMLMASVPFTTNSFMLGWRHSVGRDVFANERAKLDISLRQYETTSSGDSYAISMDVGLHGRDQYGRTLGTMNGKCSAVVRITPAVLGDFWQQARVQGTTYPLTDAARNATMWQKVMDSCVSELAKQFDTTLAAGVH